MSDEEQKTTMTDYSNLKLSTQPTPAGNPESSAYKSASGVSNVQMGGQPDDHLPYVNNGPDVRVHRGVTRATVRGDEVTLEQLDASHSIANDSAHGGILATARSQSGSRQTPDAVTENSLVTVDGRQYRVKELLGAGVLRKMPDGSIVDPSASSSQAPAQSQPEQSEQQQADNSNDPANAPQEALADAAVEQAVETLAASTSGTDQVALASALLEGRGDAHAAIERMASQSKQTPEAVRETLNGFIAALTDQAAAAVKLVAGNVDFQDWLAQAEETNPEGLAAAKRQIAYNRSPQGFKDLARSMVERADQTNPQEVIEACRQAGIRARQVGKYVVVNIPSKGEMTYAIALKQGYITAGR
jgi:hypothetical protein